MDDRAFRLLSTSAVTLFWRTEVLDETTSWLREHGYQVIQLAADWSTERELHRAIASALDFPDYYGQNLDALNDCMRDVVNQDYGWAPDAAGLVLVFVGYNAFAARFPASAQAVLDIMADRSRSALLLGRRLLCLVQSDDPHLRFDPVGATPVAWNDAEWLDSKRV